MKQQMHEAASDIQRVFRGWFWRRKAKQRTRKRQLKKITRTWRGVKGRALAVSRLSHSSWQISTALTHNSSQ
jgi:hypothetical protein